MCFVDGLLSPSHESLSRTPHHVCVAPLAAHPPTLSTRPQNAPAWFEFLDALVHYANREGVMNVVFSTPDRFLEAKKQQAKAAASSSAAAAAAADGGAAADAEEANGVVTDVAATQASYEEVGGGDSSSSSIGSTSSEDSSRQGDSASAHDARGSSSSTSSSQNTTGVRWPLKEDDFFPYRCEQDRFWTGEAGDERGGCSTVPVLKKYDTAG